MCIAHVVTPLSIYAAKPDDAARVVSRTSGSYIKSMLGIGGSEIVIIALLVLIIFGPSKLPQMARDLGRFVGEARRSIDEFKDELTAASDEEEKRKKR
jgi:Tat protein translocase TatB subunit